MRSLRLAASVPLLVGAGLAVQQAAAATSDWVGSPRASVRLVTGVDTLRKGVAAIPAGIELRLADGWDTYWRTPGDAGVAPHFDWAASDNVAAATIAWPAPQRLEVAGFQSAVYTGDVVFPVTLLRRDRSADARLALSLDYAICAQVCVPAHADLSLQLATGTGAASPEAPRLAAAGERVPGRPDAAGFAVRNVDVTGDGTGRRLTLVIDSPARPFGHPDLLVEDDAGALSPPARVVLDGGSHTATLVADLPAGAIDHPRLTLLDGSRAAEIAWRPPTPAATPHRGFAAMLAIALLGGLVLNVMPCVLPVLAIKLSSVMREAGRGRRAVRLSFAATACGILASFLALAAVPIGLRLVGATIGWGIQFQQPWFLAGLAVVTTLFAASLFEWLPIGMPGFAGRLADGQRAHALVQAFLAGVLSTVLATPCSAPFVGTAVGFALAQGPLAILAVFASLGLGMALPFLAVAAMPGLVAWLPRPGRWMLHLRTVLGLVLLGTAVWLVSLLAAMTGLVPTALILALLACLLLLRYAATRWPSAGVACRWAAVVTALAAVLLGGSAPSTSALPTPDGAWARFDPDAVTQAVASGRTVLVDVSATWCLTCKVNELTTLNTSAVQNRLVETDTLQLRADWSRPDPQVATFLQGFGRFGIPFDVVYGPGRPAGEPLPELLTPATLLATLDSARGGSPRSVP